jgi:hypothetical protein
METLLKGLLDLGILTLVTRSNEMSRSQDYKEKSEDVKKERIGDEASKKQGDDT